MKDHKIKKNISNVVKLASRADAGAIDLRALIK